MKTSTLLTTASLAFFAAAQSSTPTTSAGLSTSTCLATYVVDQCIKTQNQRLSLCATADYSCQCEVYGDFVICFNNCPADTRLATYQALRSQYCALVTTSTTSAATSTAAGTGSTSSSSSNSATTATTTTAGTSTSSPSSTSTSASSTANSGAVSGMDLAVNVGGVLVAVAGLVAAFL